MSGPWERYQAAPAQQPAGPWTRYAQEPAFKTGKGDKFRPVADPRTDFAPIPASEQQPGMVESFARGAADTATFGFGDEMAAGVTSLFGGNYDQSLANIRGQQQAAQEAHPVAFGAGQVAGVLPTSLAPGSVAVRAPSLGAKVAGGMVAGAAQGAAYGAGSADEGNRMTGAAQGAVAGGTIGAAFPAAGRLVGRLVGSARAIRNAPSVDALKKAASDLYDAADQAGVRINPQSFAKGIDGIFTDLRNAGINAKQHPKSFETFSILRRARDAAARGAPVNLRDMETLRQIAGNVLKDMDANERRVSHVIVDGIDNFMERLAPRDVIAGNAPAALNTIKAARDLWKRQSKGAIIEQAFERAKNAVGANYTAAGFETALRQKFRAIADNPRAFRRFSKEEQDAIRAVVRGAPVQNTLRFIGKFAPTGYLTGAGNIGLGAVAGPGVAIPVAAGTLAAKKAAQALSRRAANRASAIVRTGQTAPFDQGAASTMEALTRRSLTPIGRGAAVPSLLDLSKQYPFAQ